MVWLWMAALLSASFGVSVQQVYCYCAGKTTVSIFSFTDACQTDKKALALKDCAIKNHLTLQQSCCKKPHDKKEGCTKKTTRFFQLKTESEVAGSDIKPLQMAKFWTISPQVLHFTPPPQDFQYFTGHQVGRPPPVLSGRMICVRYGVFRC